MKRRIILGLGTILALISLSGCIVINIPKDGKKQQTQSVENTASDATEAEVYKAEPKKAYAIKNGDKNYLVVEIYFENKSNEDISYQNAFSTKCFQNGVEISQNNSWTSNEFDLKVWSLSVQPNSSANVYVAYETQNVNDPITVECKPLVGSGDEVNMVLGIDKTKYEASTASSVRKQIVEKPQTTVGSSNTYYVTASEFLTLRSSPSTSATSLAKLPYNTPVEFISTSSNGFSKVSYNGTTGYVVSKYLSTSPNPVPDSSELQPTYNTTFSSYTSYVRATEFVNLRVTPSSSATSLGKIYSREPVTVIAPSSGGFTKVSYYGQEGYIMSKYLSTDPNATLLE